MFRVPSVIVLLALILCILHSNGTKAQQFDENGVVYEAARNKIGLILHCRNNALLDTAIADQAITALQSDLPTLPTSSLRAGENGDQAQQAGEDGFLDAGRKRDVTSVARLFRTSPADLCREWADETLRSQEAKPGKTASTIALTEPTGSAARVKQIAVLTAPTGAAAPQQITLSASNPPMPERAPSQAARTRFASLQNTSPTGALLVPPGEKAGAVQTADKTAATPSPPPPPPAAPETSQPTRSTFAQLFFFPIAKRRPSEPAAAPGVAEFCRKQRQICRKICNLRFRDDLSGCPQTCETRSARCVSAACFKWTEQELLIGERFGGSRCAQ
jgi:hypothetical protein